MYKKLNKKQLKERTVLFEKWRKDFPDILADGIRDMPKKVALKMDFSLDSLLVLENYLLSLEEFSGEDAGYDKSNKKILDFASSYTGEVIRHQYSDKLEWGFGRGMYTTDDKTAYKFLPGLREINYLDNGINPYHSAVLSVPAIRSGDRLYNFFVIAGNMIRHWENLRKIEAEKTSVPGDGQYYHHYWLLVNDNSFDFSKLKETVKTHFKKRKQDCEVYYFNPSWLVVKLKNYNFHFSYDTSNDVQVEMKELAEDYTGRGNKTLISDSIARIEFWGDRDDNQDYMNEALFLLQNLNEQQWLHFYDFKSGHLWADKTMKST